MTTALVGRDTAPEFRCWRICWVASEFDSASIYVMSKPIREHDLRMLREAGRRRNAESFLFNGSIRENLLMGKPAASDAERWRAAYAANARQFIQRCRREWRSVVGERGVKLSVARNRLSIARAACSRIDRSDSDEVTGSVDMATERLIQEALEHLMANRTWIVIAHRLRRSSRADEYLVSITRALSSQAHAGIARWMKNMRNYAGRVCCSRCSV